MKSFAVLAFAVLVAAIYAQEPTTQPPSGVDYGGLCNGLLLQCDRKSNTVACMRRTPSNETGAPDNCETGAGVDLGRCQCTRNCGDGVYQENGDYVPSKGVCGGFVGQLCTGLVPHCTEHATCNLLTSKCVCEAGYVVTPDGKHCQQ